MWLSVNSCSTNLRVIEAYLADTSTVFAIDTVHGKQTFGYSAYEVEQETLLLLGARLRSNNQSINFINRLKTVHLVEDPANDHATVVIRLSEP